jgi:serine/threonine protein kinase
VAIKVLDKEKIQKQSMGTQVKKEISIMKLVRHVHVVSLKEVLASRTKIFIVLELVTGGELFDKIVAEGKFNETTARKYFQQLVAGTSYCHAQVRCSAVAAAAGGGCAANARHCDMCRVCATAISSRKTSCWTSTRT